MRKVPRIPFGSFLLGLLAPLAGHGQDLFIDLLDGTTLTYALEGVKSQEVDADELRLFLWDGSNEAWPLEEVRRYRFMDISTAAPAEEPITTALLIHPNPSNGEVTIELPDAGPWTVEITDLRGRVVYRMAKDLSGPSATTVRWDARDDNGMHVPSGTYVCRAFADGRVLTSSVLIQR